MLNNRNKFGYSAVFREQFLPAHLKSQFDHKREMGAYHEKFREIANNTHYFQRVVNIFLQSKGDSFLIVTVASVIVRERRATTVSFV